MNAHSLVSHMKKLPRIGVSTRGKQDVAMRYTLRMCTASQFNRVLRPFTDAATVRKCRMSMSSTSWFPLNLRLVAYRFAMHGNDLKLQLACDKLNIGEEDRRLIRRYVLENRDAMLRKGRIMYGSEVPHPEEVRKRCGQVVTDIERATIGIVNRRLRFVELFNGVSREDLFADVQARQVQQFYWGYTRGVDAGASPWLVTVAANTCRNMATRYSAQCRKSSTDRDSSGISQLLVVSNMARTADQSEVNLYDKAIDPAPSAESRVAATHIMRTLEGIARTPRQLRFFEVLVSEYDDQFDAWLSVRGLIKPHQTHADYRAKHGLDRYLDKIADYLCVDADKPRRLLRAAQTTLTSQGYA
jgi:hypothetical protein